MVAAEIAEKVPTTTMDITEVTDRPPGCKYYDKEAGLCAADLDTFMIEVANISNPLKVNRIPEVMIEVGLQLYLSLWQDMLHYLSCTSWLKFISLYCHPKLLNFYMYLQ